MSRLWQGVGGVLRSIGRGVQWFLNLKVGIERKDDPLATLYHQPLPPRLRVNWWALLLGPFWYLAKGLWVFASILFTIVLLSGGILIPFVWLYAGLKADEDLLDARIAQRSYY
ncbi:MAG: hypothetical protein AUI83_16790 [Armatimonadetes bacterium 13_1_40CM_3_65_7]|uniref:DUF2628 domain-containing protein n=1 Tax=Candidatus Segetimicrobium genomatis TaxID=2569760 RepID=A0A537KUM0_9BACT|nr:MAG: hypothetical protein AUI83_16790 [Armatimonadetes bacterium 13_1_40CM_3_65_7]TMI99454.1 MAG: DUF2628 domain-containing protein [Terrabacteria group bacterium ANGP1]